MANGAYSSANEAIYAVNLPGCCVFFSFSPSLVNGLQRDASHSLMIIPIDTWLRSVNKKRKWPVMSLFSLCVVRLINGNVLASYYAGPISPEDTATMYQFNQ